MAGELDAKGSNPGRHHGTYHAESEEIMKGENTMNSKIQGFLKKIYNGHCTGDRIYPVLWIDK